MVVQNSTVMNLIQTWLASVGDEAVITVDRALATTVVETGALKALLMLKVCDHLDCALQAELDSTDVRYISNCKLGEILFEAQVRDEVVLDGYTVEHVADDLKVAIGAFTIRVNKQAAPKEWSKYLRDWADRYGWGT